MPSREALIGLLADGELHSGADLARRLDCSRTAVWKQLHRLDDLGLVPVAEPGRGYRLERPLELLDERRLRAGLATGPGRAISELRVYAVTDSTNDRLRAAPAPAPDCMHAALAEFQTGGRGRRGRRWLSPYGCGICLSVATVLPRRPRGLPAVGLAVGVAVHRALSTAGIDGLGLKWPNDVVAEGRKLAGLLVELDGEPDGPLRLVVGVGVNLEIPPAVRDAVLADEALPPVGLHELVRAPPARNALAVELLQELCRGLRDFAAEGFSAGLAAAWSRLDVLRGRPVVARSGSRPVTGTAQGIDAEGSLLVATADGPVTVVAGEVSVRPR